MLFKHQLLSVTLTGCVVAAAAAGQPDLRLICDSGELKAMLPEGSAAWRIRLAQDRGVTTAAWNGAARLLSDGRVFDAFGRVIGRECQAGYSGLLGPGDLWTEAAATAWPEPAWDPLFEIAPVPPSGTEDFSNPPMFDSAGDAWVILTHYTSSQYQLQVRKSDGHSGTWGPTQTIYSTSHYLLGTECVMDQDDNITVVFREMSGGYQLRALRYTPAGGWGAAQQIYATPDFFQAVEAGVDQAGNVAVVCDPSPSWTPAALSVTRNAATGTWGTAQQVSPPGYQIMLPTVLHNSASDMFVVYLVVSGGPVGLYAHKFDSAACAWGPAEFLAGTESATYSSAGNAARLPGVVDNAGEATVFWGSPYVPHASRTAGGVWQPAVQLASYGIADLENFGGAAVNAAGDVFGVFSQFDGLTHFCAFRHDAGAGWQPAELPYAFATAYQTRVRVAFYQGRRAVGTMLGVQGGVQQIVSFLFDGTRWQPGLLDVPGTYQSFFADMAPDCGETLLVFEVENSGFVEQGLRATWLRAPNPGDMNCDGSVNAFDIDPFVLALTDPGGYAAAQPECYWLNADCNGDGAVNAFDIDPFVLLLTGG
jgi:hypothetical protein